MEKTKLHIMRWTLHPQHWLHTFYKATKRETHGVQSTPTSSFSLASSYNSARVSPATIRNSMSLLCSNSDTFDTWLQQQQHSIGKTVVGSNIHDIEMWTVHSLWIVFLEISRRFDLSTWSSERKHHVTKASSWRSKRREVSRNTIQSEWTIHISVTT